MIQRPDKAEDAYETEVVRNSTQENKPMKISRSFTLATLVAMFTGGTNVVSAGRSLHEYDKSARSQIKCETRRGEAVALRARQLRSKKKAFAKAYDDLIDRKMTPAFANGTTILGIDARENISYRPQTIIDGDYGMSFFPFDNGNPFTWEGLIYLRAPGKELTVSLLLDISSDDPALWYPISSYEYPPWPEDNPPGQILAERGRASDTIQKVSSVRSNDLKRISPWEIYPPPKLPNFEKAVKWLGCTIAGGAGATLRCVITGPFTLQCVAGSAAGAALTCGIASFLS